MEPYLLVIQARVLQWVVLLWVAYGLWVGQDPVTVAWRAALGGYVAMRVSRWLLDRVAAVMQERLALEEAERRLREEAQAEAAAAQAAQADPATSTPGTPARPARPVAPLIRPQPAVAGGGRA